MTDNDNNPPHPALLPGVCEQTTRQRVWDALVGDWFDASLEASARLLGDDVPRTSDEETAWRRLAAIVTEALAEALPHAARVTVTLETAEGRGVPTLRWTVDGYPMNEAIDACRHDEAHVGTGALLLGVVGSVPVILQALGYESYVFELRAANAVAR